MNIKNPGPILSASKALDGTKFGEPRKGIFGNILQGIAAHTRGTAEHGRTRQLSDLQRDLVEKSQEIVRLNSELEMFRRELGEVKETNARLIMEQKTVSQEAREKLNGMGVPAASLPPSYSGATSATDGDILKEYQRLEGREKTIFFRENKEAILRAGASQSKSGPFA